MAAELLDLVVSWPAFFVAVLVFGFAPGVLLRLIVLAYHREDPRRQELVAELYAMPRAERPFWVAEKLEVAIFEGLRYRVEWALTGRVIYRWHFTSGVTQNRTYPDTFWIPDDEEKADIEPGDTVRAMFQMRADNWCERMWVTVTEVKGSKIIGTLSNQPIGIPRLEFGDKVKLHRDHIIDIQWHDAEPTEPLPLPPPGHCIHCHQAVSCCD
jgi:hypothetical protein